jgi:hypothetical protein
MSEVKKRKGWLTIPEDYFGEVLSSVRIPHAPPSDLDQPAIDNTSQLLLHLS